jgi:hypothetical protein
MHRIQPSARVSRPRSPRAILLAQAAVAVTIGVLWPYAELRWKCRAGFEHSEACVWGRSFFSLSRYVEPVIIAPVALVVLVLLTVAWRRIAGRQ